MFTCPSSTCCPSPCKRSSNWRDTGSVCATWSICVSGRLLVQGREQKRSSCSCRTNQSSKKHQQLLASVAFLLAPPLPFLSPTFGFRDRCCAMILSAESCKILPPSLPPPPRAAAHHYHDHHRRHNHHPQAHPHPAPVHAPERPCTSSRRHHDDYYCYHPQLSYYCYS